MHMEMRRVKLLKAFTLVELLVVIAIISLLLSVVLPALKRAKRQGQKVVCLNNLRQCAVASSIYVQNHDGFYPIARYKVIASDFSWVRNYSWDFTQVQIPGKTTYEPGLLWSNSDTMEIQQCPGYKGNDNAGGEPYTGYNYNTSYIGHGSGESITEPAKESMVRSPGRTVIFGDGQYADGANKYMRAPWENPGDESFTGRYSGTQGFRHCGQTNIAFCDGHVDSQKECFTETYLEDIPMITEGTGFLSENNSLYDLK